MGKRRAAWPPKWKATAQSPRFMWVVSLGHSITANAGIIGLCGHALWLDGCCVQHVAYMWNTCGIHVEYMWQCAVLRYSQPLRAASIWDESSWRYNNHKFTYSTVNEGQYWQPICQYLDEVPMEAHDTCWLAGSQVQVWHWLSSAWSAMGSAAIRWASSIEQQLTRVVLDFRFV